MSSAVRIYEAVGLREADDSVALAFSILWISVNYCKRFHAKIGTIKAAPE